MTIQTGPRETNQHAAAMARTTSAIAGHRARGLFGVNLGDDERVIEAVS
jgi:hypothetical protein